MLGNVSCGWWRAKHRPNKENSFGQSIAGICSNFEYGVITIIGSFSKETFSIGIRDNLCFEEEGRRMDAVKRLSPKIICCCLQHWSWQTSTFSHWHRAAFNTTPKKTSKFNNKDVYIINISVFVWILIHDFWRRSHEHMKDYF